jgi:class 3 adenylate cyclase
MHSAEAQKSLQANNAKILQREKTVLEEKNKQILAQQKELEEYAEELSIAHQDLREQKVALDIAHQKSEELLLNILPEAISERLKTGEESIADYFKDVSIFFSDIKGFTALSNRVSAEELVQGLNEIVTAMDRLAKQHGLEKVKIIGDAYMAIAGVPLPYDDHAERTIKFAQDVMKFMKTWKMTITDQQGNRHEEMLQIRIGLHCGDVVAGVIGKNKFSYDVWGDTVNTAARMESNGESGTIHVSEQFVEELQRVTPSSYSFIKREPMKIKGKGTMQTYFVDV